MPKKGEAPPSQFLHLSAAILSIRQPWWRSFWFACSSPSKARGPRHLQTSKLQTPTLNVWKLTLKSKKLGVCVFDTYWHWIFSCIWFWCSTWDRNINPSITSHRFPHQLCRFNGPESRLQVEPRAELQQLQQTMKPTELQSDAPRGRPPLSVQRPVMPPTSPQGPSSPSGIDNLGQQDADRRRPGGPRDSEDSFRRFFSNRTPPCNCRLVWQLWKDQLIWHVWQAFWNSNFEKSLQEA